MFMTAIRYVKHPKEPADPRGDQPASKKSQEIIQRPFRKLPIRSRQKFLPIEPMRLLITQFHFSRIQLRRRRDRRCAFSRKIDPPDPTPSAWMQSSARSAAKTETIRQTPTSPSSFAPGKPLHRHAQQIQRIILAVEPTDSLHRRTRVAGIHPRDLIEEHP